MLSKAHTGTAVAIAWPETLCKQPGSWYEGITAFLGFNINHFYKVGHAAVLLINHSTKETHYYDFGRYHAPFQHGRIRSAVTDHDLKIVTPVVVENNCISNLKDMLHEVNQNDSCHGDGVLFASQTNINFERAQQKILDLQNACPLPYGPFVVNGTNCSRFVNTTLLAGKPSLHKRILLKLTATPTPMWNVKSLGNQIRLTKHKEVYNDPEIIFSPIQE